MATIKVKFGYSTSSNYPAALKLAHKAEEYRTEGEGKAAIHVCTFTFDTFRNLELLLEIVQGWKSTCIFVKDKPMPKRDLWQLRAVYDCWKNAYKLPHPESYCRPRPWNFEVMDKVKRELIVCRKAQFLSYDLNWFDYGYINTQGRWAIEKDHLLALLENAVSRNGADLCPLFNWSKVEAVIKGLPDTLDLAALEEMRRQKEIVFGFTVGVKEEATGENVLPFERRRK